MDKVLEDSLYKKFPVLYREREETGLQFGIRCGDGWYELVRRISAVLEEYRLKQPCRNLRITTVKMKFNELLIEICTVTKDVEGRKLS